MAGSFCLKLYSRFSRKPAFCICKCKIPAVFITVCKTHSKVTHMVDRVVGYTKLATRQLFTAR